MEKSDKIIETLDMIADDMRNDARDFDGRPFNGKTVAQYFGNQGAAIAALAKIMKAMQQEIKDKPPAPVQTETEISHMPNVGVEPKKENEKEKESVLPSERLLVDLLHAKRVLYMCLLNMPDKYLLEDSDAQALMATLAKDKQIQTILASINEGLEQHPGEDKKGRV